MNAPARTAERIAARTTDREPEKRLERPNAAHLSGDDILPKVDPMRVPKGYVMEWKRQSVLGAQDRRNMVQVARFHWQPVPHKMQPHMLGQFGKDDEPIQIGGQILMMRPAYLSDEARQEHSAETQDVLRSQLQQIQDSKKELGPGFSQHAYMKTQRVQVPADTN